MELCFELYNYHILEAKNYDKKLELCNYESDKFLQIEAFHVANAFNFLIRSICLLEKLEIVQASNDRQLENLKEYAKNKDILDMDFLQRVEYETRDWLDSYNKYGKISNTCESQCSFYLKGMMAISAAYNERFKAKS
jgi:hypothetical protein